MCLIRAFTDSTIALTSETFGISLLGRAGGPSYGPHASTQHHGPGGAVARIGPIPGEHRPHPSGAPKKAPPPEARLRERPQARSRGTACSRNRALDEPPRNMEPVPCQPVGV